MPQASTPPTGVVIWLTGLSGAGKSTIADRVVADLTRRSIPVESLDGDVIRQMFPSTGFTREARNEHVRRIGYVAALLARHGVAVVVSLISPYRESRDFARGLAPAFLEVYVSTPIEECERRDVKGLYNKARRGEIRQFTGLDDPYEPPEQPDLVIDTRTCTVEEAAAAVVRAAEAVRRSGLRPGPQEHRP